MDNTQLLHLKARLRAGEDFKYDMKDWRELHRRYANGEIDFPTFRDIAVKYLNGTIKIKPDREKDGQLLLF